MEVIDRVRQARHDRQARNELANFAAQLPLSEGPVDWQALRHDNPQFEDYLTSLESVDSLLANAVGRPQDIFFGTADTLGEHLAIDSSWEVRPAHRFKVRLMQNQSSSSEPTHKPEPFLRNVVQLTLRHIGADPEWSAEFLEKVHSAHHQHNFSTENHKRLGINDDWGLQWVRHGRYGSDVTALYLSPVRRPHYEAEWEAKVFEGIAPYFAPYAVEQVVMQRAAGYPYFGLVPVRIVEIPVSNARHDSLVTLLNQSGWRKPTEEEVEKELSPINQSSAQIRTILRHTDSDGTLPIIEVDEGGPRGKEYTTIGAFPSETMKSHFEQVVLDGIGQAANDVIRAEFVRAQEASRDRITLNAKVLVNHAFEVMGYREPERYDFSTYGTQLTDVVVEQMIEVLIGMPVYQADAERLRIIRELAKREDGSEKKKTSDWGWDPKKVSLVLPL